ncbi:glycosyltransferase family 2 protein [Parvularcula sp. LCG005]|uniref:glycosyltransferase family 2 protein n=1 Tax=Parvularcula sp. LCG005 TaxID=3078805 RepID=UPI0029433347|nr:glycosyltransferase family 2 protein [Parvularcula sp. LCG005]WOI53403.1 glycosyltransferase family 2 protein [Parvularcula sp. LCG005]
MSSRAASLGAIHRSAIAAVSPSEISAMRPAVADLLTSAAINHCGEINPTLTARRRLNRAQIAMVCILALIVAIGLVLYPVSLIVAFNTAFVGFCLLNLGLRLTLLALSTSVPAAAQEPDVPDEAALPVVTILCPLYREAFSVPGLIGALAALNYPRDRLDIKILLEADDFETIAAALALCTAPEFDLVFVPPSEPRTKPKACNFALWSARGDILVIYDAEDRPEPDQLLKAAAQFAALPDDVVCLQARLNYYNRSDSWLTRLFAIEYALLFDIVLPGLARLRAPLPLGGTSNLFRTKALMAVGGWDAFNVTEDADLGLRLAAAGLHTRTLDSTTYEEATGQVGPWLRQRSRWIKGYMQTWAVHARRGPALPWREGLSLHLVVGSVIISSLMNPIFWCLYGLWLTGVVPGFDNLFPPPLNYLATIALLLGNACHLWMFMLAPLRRRWFDLVPYALLAPIYWVLQSAAGYRAAAQFITSPHYWEKTSHGEGKPIQTILAKLR